MTPRSLDLPGIIYHTSAHIRPLAVRPLNYPEGVPNPWGFSFSGPRYFATQAHQPQGIAANTGKRGGR